MGDLQEGLLRARLFRSVPEQLVATALTGCQTRQLSATETLLRAGTGNDILYIVVSGQVSVRVPGVDEPHVRLGAGDAVLRRVAHTLATGLRPQDSLARYGGEEFTVLMPGLGRQQALQVAERLRLAIQANRGDSKRDHVAQITISIGVATATHDESLAALLRRADEALYRAKESGRNCTRD
jgi:hypothetical protein